MRNKVHIVALDIHIHLVYPCSIMRHFQFPGSNCGVVVSPDRDDDGVIHVYSKESWKPFTMDKVFGSRSTQEQVITVT